MKFLTLKLPRLLGLSGGKLGGLGGGPIELHGDLRYLDDRTLADIGLPRRSDRVGPRPYWLP